MLLKSRASLTCFRACFLPGWAKDLSAPWYLSRVNSLNKLAHFTLLEVLKIFALCVAGAEQPVVATNSSTVVTVTATNIPPPHGDRFLICQM